MDEKATWRWLLKVASRTVDPSSGARHGQMTLGASALFPGAADIGPAAQRLIRLYLPLCRGCPERLVVAHLGQSLDVLFECRFDG